MTAVPPTMLASSRITVCQGPANFRFLPLCFCRNAKRVSFRLVEGEPSDEDDFGERQCHLRDQLAGSSNIGNGSRPAAHFRPIVRTHEFWPRHLQVRAPYNPTLEPDELG